MDQGSVWVN